MIDRACDYSRRIAGIERTGKPAEMDSFHGEKSDKKNVDMLGRAGVVSRVEAQNRFLRHLQSPTLSDEEIDVPSSLGRIVSRGICSPIDLPEFSRGTMDGYAVRAKDTFGAAETLPAYLNIVGEVPMGSAPGVKAGAGDAVRIATGGMLPDGTDAVVMFEQTSVVDEQMIEVSRPVAAGENVIQTGEDIRKDQVIFQAGHRIRPQDIGALCGVGVTGVHAYRRPRAAVIPTGNEIISPGQAAAAGQVRDINSYHLCALIGQTGGEPVRFGIVPDDKDQLKEAVLKAVSETDLVLLSGGSSVGTKDLTAAVITELGKPGILVHGVAVKPGKPTLCAMVNGRPVIGLPGHPAAVAIGFDLFVRPVLRILSGESTPPWEGLFRRSVRAKITRNIASHPGREDYVRVALDFSEEGLTARPILGKSGLISTLVDAVGVVVVPENKLGLEKGEEVEVELFDK